MAVGVVRADQKLDSYRNCVLLRYSADGVCALQVGSESSYPTSTMGSAHIMNIRWRPGDTVEVRVAFEDATTACVTFHSSRADLATLGRALEGVPACGLRFGVGLEFEDSGVMLVASSVDAGVGVL